MISGIFNTVLYSPLYNALVFLAGILPGADIGLSVIILTLVVKLLLFPNQHKGRIRQKETQEKMVNIQDETKKLKKKHEGNKAGEAQALMDLYKKHDIKPFSGFLPILIQFPILLALYWVFIKGIPFTSERLYGFVSLPEVINFNFLGLFELTERSIILAVLVAITMYFQTKIAIPEHPKKIKGDQSFAEDLSRSMTTNMKYVMPIVLGVIAYTLPAVVSVYFITSNLFSLSDELLIKKKMKDKKNKPPPTITAENQSLQPTSMQ